jgi:hypothetical protein
MIERVYELCLKGKPRLFRYGGFLRKADVTGEPAGIVGPDRRCEGPGRGVGRNEGGIGADTGRAVPGIDQLNIVPAGFEYSDGILELSSGKPAEDNAAITDVETGETG